MSFSVKNICQIWNKSTFKWKINFANFLNLEIYSLQFYKTKGILDVYIVLDNLTKILALHKKWSFPLRISSANVKDFFTFTEEVLIGKLHFLCSVKRIKKSIKESKCKDQFPSVYFVTCNVLPWRKEHSKFKYF